MSERLPRTRSMMLVLGIVAAVGLTVAVQLWWGRALAKRFDDAKPAVAQSDGEHSTIAPYPRPVLPDEGYVGGDQCATCHATIAKTFQRHPMSRSLATVQAAVPVEDYQQRNPFEAGVCNYRVDRQDGKLVHHESLADTDGTLLYDISTEIQFVMGSGSRGRSYLTQRGDILTTSSIGWYAEKTWYLSPGYNPVDHPHFNRRVTEACLQCHAGRVNTDRSNVNHFPAPAFLEAAISCERCHGPGARHVAFRRAKVDDLGKDPIVNPAKLPTVEREAVCSQCHLQATERILRYGRSHQDFRPGQRINDIWTVFFKGTGSKSATSAELVTQVEQMQSSVCYQKSAGRMGCTSCHDPHDYPERESRSLFYQSKCLACHTEQGCSLDSSERELPPANGRCVVCHMPQISSDDIPHTSQSDHRILRRPKKSVRKPVSQELTVFQEPGFQLPKLEMDRARGLMLSQIAEQSKNISLAIESEMLLKRFLAVAPDDIVVLESLGAVCIMQSRPRDAEEYLRTILQHSPQHEQALLRLAVLVQDSGRMAEARELLDRFLKVNPTLPQLLFRNSQVLAELNQLDAAIPFAQQAIKLFPRRLPLYDWLAKVHAGAGDHLESERIRKLRDRISKRLMEAVR